MALMAALRPEEEQALAQARMAAASPSVIQHPMHAITAPISAPPPDLSSIQLPDDSTPDTGGMSPQPKVRQMSPLERYQDKVGSRMSADLEKDANPYGSANNHPGFFGKLLHGLSVATGGPNRREFEEDQLGKQLQDTESDNAKLGLEKAQTRGVTATAAHTEAETPEVAPNAASQRGLQGAETRHLNAESDDLENPEPTFSIHDTEAGPLFVNNKTGSAQHLTVDGVPVGPKMKLTQSQPIMGPDGKPHTYMIDDKGNKVADLGVHYERPITVNAGNARAERNDLLKAYEPTLESAERMNVMTDAYEKAIKDHDQQAMLNLLANHLGMTMGLQKGARLTKDIIHEAQESQPWLQKIGAKFDKDGYLAGVTLSPNQMRQMVNLGQQRYIEDAKKSRSIGQYLGSTDDGPARIPGKATINYYLGLANGDPTKAKELAAQDGWTVK